MVLIFSSPCFSASWSKRVNTSFSIVTMNLGGISSDSRVKLMMSANITVTSAKPSAIVMFCALRRSAIGPGRMLSSSRSDFSCSIVSSLFCSFTCS
ncbi:hypothetical protein D3C83_12200 [compost metagenome]